MKTSKISSKFLNTHTKVELYDKLPNVHHQLPQVLLFCHSYFSIRNRIATNYFGWREIFILGRKKPDKNSDMENETLEKIIEAGGYTQPATPSR